MRVLADVAVEAGPHRRLYTPVSVLVERKTRVDKLLLVDKNGIQIPAQFRPLDEGVEVSWIVEGMESLGSLKLTLLEDSGAGIPEVPRLLARRSEGQADVLRGDELVMSCHYSEAASKPFVFPLNGPSGTTLTWNGPPDHAHHRSMWVAHGQVNGNDLWSELPNHGAIVATDTPTISAGPVYCEIGLSLVWQAAQGNRLLDEERNIRLWNVPDRQWLLDQSSVFSASYGDVALGDTKEGGMLCVRVRESMEVDNGGKIENSWGGVNEAETWGKKANWCDYSGPVEGNWQGIAIFDSLANPRHPTYWHVRDYGLMTANVLGTTAFNGREDERGGMLIKNGGKLSFHHRVCVHNGDAHVGEVASKYVDYVQPPRVHLSMK